MPFSELHKHMCAHVCAHTHAHTHIHIYIHICVNKNRKVRIIKLLWSCQLRQGWLDQRVNIDG